MNMKRAFWKTFTAVAGLVALASVGAAQEILDFGEVPVGETEVRSITIPLPPGWTFSHVDGPTTEAFTLEDVQVQEREVGELGPQVDVTLVVGFSPPKEGSYADHVTVWGGPVEDPELGEGFPVELRGKGVTRPTEEGDYSGPGPEGGSVYEFDFTAEIKGFLLPPIYDCETGERIEDVQVELVPTSDAVPPYDIDEIEKIYLYAEGYYPLVIDEFETLKFEINLGFFTIQATYIVPGLGGGVCFTPPMGRRGIVRAELLLEEGKIDVGGENEAEVNGLEIELEKARLWLVANKPRRQSFVLTDALNLTFKNIRLKFGKDKRREFKVTGISLEMTVANLEEEANMNRYERMEKKGVLTKQITYKYIPQDPEEGNRSASVAAITKTVTVKFRLLTHSAKQTEYEEILKTLDNAAKQGKWPGQSGEFFEKVKKLGFDVTTAKVKGGNNQWELTIGKTTKLMITVDNKKKALQIDISIPVTIKILEFTIEEPISEQR